jgi:RNA polymerase sigma factor (sigma-70 family)
VEVSALTRTSTPGLRAGLRGPSPLLRLQSDERLIELTRRGQHAAFETLCARYESRLLSFCRHMLNSREDAEDILQEVFAAAFNAVLADERAINVRPWLYRIARNRSLNHLRRASAIGVDSMDVHFADNGLSTSDRVLRRESFRQLLADVQQLPETQRTALLLREIDALSYDQIAQAMEATVPSVKSLLVRARISLAEAAEARKLSCEEVRLELGEVAEGLAKLSAPARRHVRECKRCHGFKQHLKQNNHALAFLLPVGPLLIAKKLVLAKLGSTASASGAHVAGAGAGGATVGAGAGLAATGGGGGVAGGVFTAGAGAVASKAVAGLAAAAIVTAGAVAADNTTAHHHASHATGVHALASTPVPIVIAQRPQPLTRGSHRRAVAATAPRRRRAGARAKAASLNATATHAAPAPAPADTNKPADPKPEPTATQVTQVTSETTALPSDASDGQPVQTVSTSAAPPAPTPPAASPEPPPAAPAPEASPPSSPPAPPDEQPASESSSPEDPAQTGSAPTGSSTTGSSQAETSRNAPSEAEDDPADQGGTPQGGTPAPAP